MLGSFKGWESSKVKEGDRRNVGLKELQSLHKLRCLQIEIEDKELAKEEIRLSPKIVKNYAIFIGPRGWRDFNIKSEKVLSLRGFPRNTSNFASWIHQFASSAEEIYLDGDGSINLDLSQVYNTITTLQIENCEMLEEVAKTSTNSNQEGSTSLFKNLTRLRLEGMPSLIHLVRPNQDASFSSLRRIQIERCHKLRNLFSLRRTNDGILLLPQQLEELIIEDCEMMEVVFLNEENEENNGSASGIGTIIFSKLVKLDLRKMPMLTALVRGAEMIKFPSLEELKIVDCPKLKSIECGKGRGGDGRHNNGDESLHLFCTKKVHFSGLKNLKLCGYNEEVVNNIWCPQISSCFFQTLKSLKISNCHKLSSLFTPSIVKNLVILNHLWVVECEEMEQVVGVDEERNEICSEKDKDCGEMGGEGGDILDNHNHDYDDAFHLFCHQKVKFDALKFLIIDDGGNVINGLWCQRIPQHLFRALEFLSISNFQNIKNLFSSSMVDDKMIMVDDKVRDEISKEKWGRIREQKEEQNDDNDDGGNIHRITLSFPKLRQLDLYNLANLTCFGKGMESIEFPMLEELWIEECPELIGMVVPSEKSKNNDNEEMEEGQKQKLKHDDENSHVLCNHKVKISALETIRIWGCNNLRSLFSCTMVENLVNFKRLSVKGCNQVEKVITGEKDIQESSTLFPSLESIEFEDLDSLRMFCARKGPLELPCLENISIEGCPKMEFLTPGSISTPKLCKISILKEVFEEEEWNEMEDLNRFVHHHIMSKREESIAPVVEHGETSKKNMDEIDVEEQT